MEGKSQLSTWESLASWLEREAGISESKQRWMLEEKDWRRPDSVRSGVRKIGDHSVPGLFAGTTGENSSRANNVAVKCPVHKSTNHKLQECKVFERMSTNEMEQVVDKHRLCLSCLSPGHRLNKCRNKHRCTVEGCDMRNHTLVDDVDLKFIERRRAIQEPQRMVDSARSSVNTLQHSQQIEATSNQVEELCQQCSHSVSLGLETRGRALETLPVVVFGDKGERQVMALRDSGCNTTLMDENLAAALGLSGKEVEGPPTEHLLNQIRQEYWIIHDRQAVRDAKFKCNYCYCQTVKPQEQKMGNLHECRLELGMVFRNTGVDFFGPMLDIGQM